MLLPRTTARAAPARLALVLILVAPASAAELPLKPPDRIVFPVVGKTHFTDDFGAARAQGGHQATDIMADWRAPVVAAEAGAIKLWTKSARAGCMLYLYGRSGTTYLYVHLNNDLTAKNDNRGGCRPDVAFARGLADGQQVRAGALLGYVGDSGDASGIRHHVHFELHPPRARPVSPYPWLRRAHTLLFSAAAGSSSESSSVPLMLTLRGAVVRASASSLAVAVDRVELSTGERFDVDREVRFSIAPANVVERIANGRAVPARLDSAARGEPVTVQTSPASDVLAAQIAAPGVLEAARITFRR